MPASSSDSFSIFAPAKLNLYLHVTERLPNGYHALDSLVGFSDIGDWVRIVPADQFTFQIEGDFAHAFRADDVKADPGSSNLVVKAVWALSRALERAPNVSVTLEKNLPLGAGIGGGSSDAATVIWGLLKFWNVPTDHDALPALLKALGADVPVCFHAKTARIRGIGDVLDAVPDMPDIPVVLIYPGHPCATQSVFKGFSGGLRDVMPLPPVFEDFGHVVDMLNARENVLLDAACGVVPEIENVIQALSAYPSCALARMSGSGSSCFGVFEHVHDAQNAADAIARENPDWWVQTGILGSVERY